MVKTAMAIEKEVDDAWSIQDAGASDKRKESQLSASSLGDKQRTSTPRGFQGQGQGQDQSSQDRRQFRATSKSGQRICFHCYQPRHLSRDFPQRQGSQGYGTPLSQSSVGHAQTRFFPPYPTMGQDNQY